VGGVGIYIKNSITHKQYDGLKILSENDCVLENVWLEISKDRQTYIIGGMYRHPGQNLEKFTNVLENTLIQIRKLNKPCLIAGDFNIDLLKYNIHQITSNYIENHLFVVDRPLRFSYLSRLAASGALAEFRCGHLTD